MRKIIAIVGMAGSGKSEAARIFEKSGFRRVRFGDLTDREVKARGLPLTEENERRVREELRREYGMAAYARLNLGEIEAALAEASVVIDGLYSWEEYTLLKAHFGAGFSVLAVWASPETRYTRLGQRAHRGRSQKEAASRDGAEIEQVNKGGPIAMADYTVANEAGLAELHQSVEEIVKQLK